MARILAARVDEAPRRAQEVNEQAQAPDPYLVDGGGGSWPFGTATRLQRLHRDWRGGSGEMTLEHAPFGHLRRRSQGVTIGS